ncbi:Heterocyst differentiation ATP-binding protein HepA [Planktothrix tepida]|uniref:ABC transporter related protein n=1 Tax=Planktothrix tepida PCC 9214 TaxID=671072 RepID=A0A1J1LFB6_9CYAN|nr:ABC transporter ATP-binding protein [Planktothrix tepida]CAD5923792.1 Heterocyst differentiation ATP-binding protein HepA [Planktothrix tepida]CUR31128.1 ABC transporter related protein [Planktothrix tepida PCC 9214]
MLNKNYLVEYARRYPIRIILTILLGFSGAIFSGVSTTLIVPVVLNLLGQQMEMKGAPPFIQKILAPFGDVPEPYRLGLMAGAILLALILKNLTTYWSSLVSSSLGRALTCDMREAGLKLLLDVDLDFYAKTKVGDLINQLGGEIARSSSAIGIYIGMFTTSITIFVFVLILLSISWQLTLATGLLLFIVTILNQYIIGRAKQSGNLLSEASRNYSIKQMEVLNGIRLVKATANEKPEYKQLKKLIREREKADYKAQMASAAIAPINEVVNMLVLLVLIVIGKFFLSQDQITALSTILLTYLFILFRTLPLISQLNNARSNLAQRVAAINIIGEFLRRDNKPIMKIGSISFTGLKEGIHFNNISFTYPGHDKIALQNIDLYLPRGTTLALVGGSGAGKSTLADLLPRFYDPTGGSIVIDGQNLRDFDLQSLRKSMGIVSQDTFLFNASVRDNIAYAKPDATDEEIIFAAQQANAEEFITKLPQGFLTPIGDRGVLLSGGQRQRISIARAILQNPDILILDEATSALDTVSERLVQEAIDKLSHDRTTVVIAHRLSTIQKANQIAVLDQGCLAEVGTHDQLLAKGGKYAQLYTLQFADEASRDRAIIRSSYEVRSRLNPMIGFLQLLADELVDDPEERQELLNESYRSATFILDSLEFIEQSVKIRLNSKLLN